MRKPKLGPLVVMAKIRRYIREKHDMNTAGEVTDALSLMIEDALDIAAEKAESDGLVTIKAKHLPDLDLEEEED